MRVDLRTVIICSAIVVSSILAAGLMYSVTDDMSGLAFFGWAVMFAAPQFALLPAYARGSCKIMDRLASRR